MIRFWLLALCLCFPLVSRAEIPLPIMPGKQVGWITFSSRFGLDKASSKAWAQFCKHLGEELSFPGPGFLSSYTCQDSKVSLPSPPRSWHLELFERKRTFELKLYFRVGSASQLVQKLSFPIEGRVLDKLNNVALPVALAKLLVESNPTGWGYKHSEEGPSFDTGREFLTLPEELLVYRLAYDKGKKLWVPSIRAQISKVKERKSEEDNAKISYSIDPGYLPLKRGQSYWVRALDNEERQWKYRAIISAALQGEDSLSLSHGSKDSNFEKKKSFLDNYLLNSLQSSYAGFRYGKSIARSDSIVTQVDMVSVLAEIGGGPLAGLRAYYDLLPELRRGNGNDLEYFSLRRASLGWAFSFEMPPSIQPFFSKLDVQPKIGLLDIKTYFFATAPGGKAVLEFTVKNVVDLGLEVGVEQTSTWLRSRLWGGTSTANLGASPQSSVTVKSLSGGVDLYFNLYEAGDWDVNLLTFAKFEKLELAKDPKSVAPNTLELYFIRPSLVFAGLGITVSW